jgi:hypothetical protein
LERVLIGSLVGLLVEPLLKSGFVGFLIRLLVRLLEEIGPGLGLRCLKRGWIRVRVRGRIGLCVEGFGWERRLGDGCGYGTISVLIREAG